MLILLVLLYLFCGQLCGRKRRNARHIETTRPMHFDHKAVRASSIRGTMADWSKWMAVCLRLEHTAVVLQRKANICVVQVTSARHICLGLWGSEQKAEGQDQGKLKGYDDAREREK